MKITAFFNLGTRRFGRNVEPHLATLASLAPDPLAALAAAELTDLDRSFALSDPDPAVQSLRLRRFEEQVRAMQLAPEMQELAMRIHNRPQLWASVSYHDRDATLGPRIWLARATWEIGARTGDHLALSLEYFFSEAIDTPPPTLPQYKEDRRLIYTATYGRMILDQRFDFSYVYSDGVTDTNLVRSGIRASAISPEPPSRCHRAAEREAHRRRHVHAEDHQPHHGAGVDRVHRSHRTAPQSGRDHLAAGARRRERGPRSGCRGHRGRAVQAHAAAGGAALRLRVGNHTRAHSPRA